VLTQPLIAVQQEEVFIIPAAVISANLAALLVQADGQIMDILPVMHRTFLVAQQHPFGMVAAAVPNVIIVAEVAPPLFR
jgi:hypothetical protein